MATQGLRFASVFESVFPAGRCLYASFKKLIPYNLIMSNKQKLVAFFYRARSSYYRWSRILFPSAAEIRFIEIMGGRFYCIHWIKHPKTKRPLTFVTSLGRYLQDERYGREVRVGKYFIDFGNDVSMGLEVDGAQYHRDIVREFDRDVYLQMRGWRVVHIPAIKLWNDPADVQRTVLKFIYR